ncbi:hypothetical protein DYB35_007958 [Aphanomyces astaci]|uniref:Uncharacterized protein n=1 Tax=Aphanomyces astaci TaxID=112090 RepID=A0A3R6Y555_APHAT|nr:hypothetical protein DYB35_007958 [Aphanomyces astaci]
MHILKKSLTKRESAVASTDSTSLPPPPPNKGSSAKSEAPAGKAASNGEASPGTQIRHGSVVLDTRMSDNIFDHILGRGRAIDMMDSSDDKKSTTTPSHASARFSTMDSNVEYWDKDGIHRRSSTITRRMNLRGMSIPHAVDPLTFVDTAADDDDPAGEAIPSRPPSPSRQDIDGVSKAQLASKQTHIQAVDAALQRSLAQAYKPPPLSKLALAGAQHTANAPSKLLQYVL